MEERPGASGLLMGIDGCRAGWIVAASDVHLSTLAFDLVPDLEPVIARVERAGGVIAIDIPIGLSDGGPRDCDREARRRLGRPRGSSVFPAPCRAALRARDYRMACALSRRAGGVALSRQCFAIIGKIRELDVRMTPARQAFVREAHPELVFAVLDGRGRGLVESKKTEAGERARRRLLRGVAPDFDPAAVRAGLGRGGVARDDVIDAVACLVAARRVASGTMLVLPEGPVPRDARGLRMEIVA